MMPAIIKSISLITGISCLGFLFIRTAADPHPDIVASTSGVAESVATAHDDSTAHVVGIQNRLFSKSELMGKFDPSAHEDFVLIAREYTSKPSIYLRKACYDAFILMHNAAGKEGIDIQILSATRNFEYQKNIWEKKWKREKYAGWSDTDKVKDILRYSSMPGTSRHHWGTDVDFNSVEPGYFATGQGLKLYNWLLAHAREYGFVQTYTARNAGRTGYEEEKWHWSYLPLSGPMLDQYNSTITYADLTGFSGCQSAAAARVIEDYVNGISRGN